MDMEGYKTSVAIRDFPIDWTVLTENIMVREGPAHGSAGSYCFVSSCTQH